MVYITTFSFRIIYSLLLLQFYNTSETVCPQISSCWYDFFSLSVHDTYIYNSLIHFEACLVTGWVR